MQARILVVEDEAIVGMDIRSRLTALGYTVVGVVSSGKAAIKKAVEMQPNVVLMDIRLKGEMDGVEAAERIQTDHDVPVVFLTAHADEATLRRAKITAPFGYILKPFETRELQTALEIALYRHKTEQRLKAYAARVERSNRELEFFAYVASHDLREPLRKILAFGDRLTARYGDVLDERGEDYLARMQSAAARMQAMIDSLLTYSRVTTQARPFEPVDLGQVAREVVADLQVPIGQSGGRVQVGELPTVHADPIQMQQLLQNLISNGLKFHRQDRPPEVRIYAGDGAAKGSEGKKMREIVIQDNGIGFEEKYKERIFQMFQRLHGRGEYEGTGIGLATCQKIVERHGGAIAAESAPGQGATFIVTLPSAPQDESHEH